MTESVAVSLPPDIQSHADQAIRSLGRGMVPATDADLSRVTAWLEDEALSRIVNYITAARGHVYAVDLLSLVDDTLGDVPDEVACELRGSQGVVPLLRSRLERLLGGAPSRGVSAFRLTVPVAGSSGVQAVVGLEFHHFDLPVVWDGLFSTRNDYIAWLGNQGFLASLEQFDQLDPTAVMKACQSYL